MSFFDRVISSTPPRCERKYVVNQSLKQIIYLIKLHPANFKTPYPSRNIANIYFDTPQLTNLQNAVNGTAERLKVRWRWYNSEFPKNIQWEIKLKYHSNIYKLAYPLKIASLSSALKKVEPHGKSCGTTVYDTGVNTPHREPSAQLITHPLVNQWLSGAWVNFSQLPKWAQELNKYLKPVLYNRYHRYYFINADKTVRLTLDHQLSFSSPFSLKQLPVVNRSPVIVELKYSPSEEPEAEEIGGTLPFVLTKNSKYVRGMSPNL